MQLLVDLPPAREGESSLAAALPLCRVRLESAHTRHEMLTRGRSYRGRVAFLFALARLLEPAAPTAWGQEIFEQAGLAMHLLTHKLLAWPPLALNVRSDQPDGRVVSPPLCQGESAAYCALVTTVLQLALPPGSSPPRPSVQRDNAVRRLLSAADAAATDHTTLDKRRCSDLSCDDGVAPPWNRTVRRGADTPGARPILPLPRPLSPQFPGTCSSVPLKSRVLKGGC